MQIEPLVLDDQCAEDSILWKRDGREKDPDIHVDVRTPFTPTTSEDGEIAFGDACDKATRAKAR